MKKIVFLVIALAGLSIAGAEDKNSGKLLTVLKAEGTVYIRSHFNDTEDLLITLGLGKNKQVNFTGGFLLDKNAGMDPAALKSARNFHRNGDDACALIINGTAIGGNHGAAVGLELTCENHGRTVEDIGSEWRDEKGRKFYLIKIPDKDKLLFLGENKSEGDIWKFERRIEGSEIKSDSRNSSINFTGKRWGVQMWPSCRIKKQDYLLDGKTPLKEGEPVSCRWLDIVEDYDIIDPSSLLEDFISHPGENRSFVSEHLEAVLNNVYTYRFFPGGANVVYNRIKALKSFNMEQYLGVMTAQLAKKDYQAHQYYIPKTVPFELNGVKYDFRSMQDFYPSLPEPVYFSGKYKNLSDPLNPPDRFIQFLGKKDGDKITRDVGFALGYSLIHGISVPSERVKNTENFIWIYKTNKTYPASADKKMGIFPAGNEIYFVGYRQYFDPGAAGNATCLYWNTQEKDIIIYADYHTSVEKDRLKLSPELEGRRFDIIEKTPSLTLHSETRIPAEGLEVSVRDGYGYMVLRVSGEVHE